MSPRGLKLWVWEGVLNDYTSGMIVAIATDLESAINAIDDSYVRSEMGRVSPTIIELKYATEAKVFYVWGGG